MRYAFGAHKIPSAKLVCKCFLQDVVLLKKGQKMDKEMVSVDLDTVKVVLLFRNEAIVKCYEHVVVLRHAPAVDNCFEPNFRWILTSGQYTRRGTCVALLCAATTSLSLSPNVLVDYSSEPSKIIPLPIWRAQIPFRKIYETKFSQDNELSHNKFAFPVVYISSK